MAATVIAVRAATIADRVGAATVADRVAAVVPPAEPALAVATDAVAQMEATGVAVTEIVDAGARSSLPRRRFHSGRSQSDCVLARLIATLFWQSCQTSSMRSPN